MIGVGSPSSMNEDEMFKFGWHKKYYFKAKAQNKTFWKHDVAHTSGAFAVPGRTAPHFWHINVFRIFAFFFFFLFCITVIFFFIALVFVVGVIVVVRFLVCVLAVALVAVLLLVAVFSCMYCTIPC
jgi:hypothetical protein